MTVLFGHPSGNPNSHQAALAHFESGRLEAFCVPWMPSPSTLSILEHIAPLRPLVQRLRRRCFRRLLAHLKFKVDLENFGVSLLELWVVAGSDCPTSPTIG